MTNSERIQAHNAELREAIQMAENLPDVGSGEVVEPIIEPLEVTENGTYIPSDDIDGYNPVTVNVPIPDGYIVPDGTKEIEENGTHDVAEYASVNVNVPTGNEALETILFDNGGSVTIPSVKKPIRAYSFYNCTKLTSVTIPEGVTGLNIYAFYGCSSLTEIILPKTLTTIGSYSFRNCTTLNRVVLNAATITVGQGSMMDCTALTTLDIQGKAHFLASSCANCSSLNALILRSNTMCTVAASSAFSNSGVANGTAYIYVPSALVDTYKGATTWSVYADQIRAIEDYPEITGG